MFGRTTCCYMIIFHIIHTFNILHIFYLRIQTYKILHCTFSQINLCKKIILNIIFLNVNAYHYNRLYVYTHKSLTFNTNLCTNRKHSELNYYTSISHTRHFLSTFRKQHSNSPLRLPPSIKNLQDEKVNIICTFLVVCDSVTKLS